MPVYKQGKHSKYNSIILDEHNQMILKDYLRKIPDYERNPNQLRNAIYNNEFQHCIMNIPPSISIRTATRWFHTLGFHPDHSKKGYYTDDHNRADVVQYRDIFLKQMEDFEKTMIQYDGPLLTPIVSNDKKTVLITHDESLFYSNEGVSVVWMENGKKKLKPKSNGLSIMVSAFVCDCHGIMIDDELNLKSYYSILPGKNRDGWFTNDDLIEQLNNCMPLFNKLHPNSNLLFAFDNSMTHHKRPNDGLNADLIPLKDGGKNVPIMRPTQFKDDNNNIIQQSLQYENGIPKGIKTILEERKKWNDSFGLECKDCKAGNLEANRTNCCARNCLRNEDDFKNQKEALAETVENSGHKIIFYPKFHCEMNYIEMYWCYVKSQLRKQCSFNFKDLQAKLPMYLETVPLQFYQRAYRHCLRVMSAYRVGLEGPLLDYAVRQYSSHRKIPEALVNQIRSEYEIIINKKRKLN